VVIPVHDDNPTRRKPIVTLVLIAACIVVFAVVQPRSEPKSSTFTYEHAAIPCEIDQGYPLTRTEAVTARCTATADLPSQQFFPDKNVWLAVLYSMFLHGSWLHLAGNMLFLWVFGNNVEDRFTPVGYLFFYVFAGIVATAAYVASDPASVTPLVGASGAIAGVMGAYLVLWPRARIVALVPFFLFIPVRLPAAFVLLFWFGMQFLTGPNTGVAWVAHVGGFVAGMGVGFAVRALFGPHDHVSWT
jgi:membrane associated rhomboid family serine protease